MLKPVLNNLEFTLKLIDVLKQAEDPHLHMDYKGKSYYPDAGKYYVSNFNIPAIAKSLKDIQVSKSESVVSGTFEGIGYICIATWDHNKGDEIRTAIDRLKELDSIQHLIVDVRINGGGDETLAKEFASCFVSETTSYGKVKYYDPKTKQFDIERVKVFNPNPDGYQYKGQVYVLIGPKCMSSNEGFVLMMQQADNAKLVGMRTRGSSGNPKPYALNDEITLFLPSWQAFTLEGQAIEGVGVKPDVEIIHTPADFKGKDALFSEVVTMIKNREN